MGVVRRDFLCLLYVIMFCLSACLKKVCVRACVRARACMCVCVCVHVHKPEKVKTKKPKKCMYKNVSHVHTRETTLYHSVCVLSEPLTAEENTTDSGTPCPIQVQAACLILSFSATVLWATVFCRTIFTTNTCQPRHNGCRNARCLDLSPLPCAWSRLAALPCLMARWRAGSQGSLSCSSSLIHSLARPFLHSLSR